CLDRRWLRLVAFWVSIINYRPRVTAQPLTALRHPQPIIYRSEHQLLHPLSFTLAPPASLAPTHTLQKRQPAIHLLFA
ncbi:hypothetical protein CALVIDRAFT_495671, partial [Calocera viscosa TUFC12733]